MEIENYSLIWQQCTKDARLSERFFVPGFRGSLPFFLSGDDLDQFKTEGKLNYKEKHLLQGVFYGLYEIDNDPKPWHREKDRKTYLYLLDILGQGFGFDDPEKLILDVAASMREKNGSEVSRIVLHTGLKLFPFSSKIRSDLICDTWNVLSQYGNDEVLLKDVVDLTSETYLKDVLPDAKEVICYYGLCALVLNNAEVDEITSYLKEFVYPNVNLRNLKVKIKDLLDNPTAFSARDLKVI